MADKKIKIHIASSADLRAMKDVSTEAVLMTRQVKSANAELRQAILKTAADYDLTLREITKRLREEKRTQQGERAK